MKAFLNTTAFKTCPRAKYFLNVILRYCLLFHQPLVPVCAFYRSLRGHSYGQENVQKVLLVLHLRNMSLLLIFPPPTNEQEMVNGRSLRYSCNVLSQIVENRVNDLSWQKELTGWFSEQNKRSCTGYLRKVSDNGHEQGFCTISLGKTIIQNMFVRSCHLEQGQFN